MSSDSDYDMNDLDALVSSLNDGTINTMDSLLGIFGCELEGNKFTHKFLNKNGKESQHDYTLNFAWKDNDGSSTKPELISFNSEVVVAPQETASALPSYLSRKIGSANVRRQDTLARVVQHNRSFDATDEELKRMLKMIREDVSNITHVAFCFASPLRAPHSSKSKPDLPLLNFKREFEGISEVMKGIKRNVRFCKSVATASTITGILASNPCVLHFSGHGAKEHSEINGNGSLEKGEQGDYLIIENEFCGGQDLNQKILKKLLSNAELNIHVAVVLSCHSEYIGQMFLNAGVKHVI